jgi:5-methylcytosine-specific restriction endonuclease McrA
METTNIIKKCAVTECVETKLTKANPLYCLKHYACWKRTGDPIARNKPHKYKICLVEGCAEKHRRNGYCGKHSFRLRRHGDPTKLNYNVKYHTDEERLEAHKRNKQKYKEKLKTDPGRMYNARIRRQRKRHKKSLDVKLSSRETHYIHEYYQNQCLICKTKEDLTLDHYVCLDKGGKFELTNIVLLCRSCNGKKTDKDPEVFYSKEQLHSINEFFNVVKKRKESLRTVYLLCGANGAGKSWVSSQLDDKFHKLNYDTLPKDMIQTFLEDAPGDKPILFELPFKIVNFMNSYGFQFNIKPIFIVESDDVIKVRIVGRGGEFTNNVRKRAKRIREKYVKKYTCFSGTSQECLDYLKKV